MPDRIYIANKVKPFPWFKDYYDFQMKHEEKNEKGYFYIDDVSASSIPEDCCIINADNKEVPFSEGKAFVTDEGNVFVYEPDCDGYVETNYLAFIASNTILNADMLPEENFDWIPVYGIADNWEQSETEEEEETENSAEMEKLIIEYPDPKYKSAVIYKFDGKIQAKHFSYYTTGSNDFFSESLKYASRIETNDAQWLQEAKEELIQNYREVCLKPLVTEADSIEETYLFDFDNRFFEIYKPNTEHRKLTPDDEFYFMYEEFGEDVEPPVLYDRWSFDSYKEPLQARLKYCKLEDKREELTAIAEKAVNCGEIISDEDLLNALLQMKRTMCPDYKPEYNYKTGESVVRYSGLQQNSFYGKYIDDFRGESATVHFKNVVMADIAADCLNLAVSNVNKN